VRAFSICHGAGTCADGLAAGNELTGLRRELHGCLTKLIEEQHMVHVAAAIVEYRSGHVGGQLERVLLHVYKQVVQRHAGNLWGMRLGFAKCNVKVVSVSLEMSTMMDSHGFCVDQWLIVCIRVLQGDELDLRNPIKLAAMKDVEGGDTSPAG
jgi:hypothetical protein